MDAQSMYTYPTIEDRSSSSPRAESPTLGLGFGSTSGSVTAVDRFEYNWEQYTAPSSPAQDPPISAFSFLTFTSTPAPSPRSEQAWPSAPFMAANSPYAPYAEKTTPQFTFHASPVSPAPLPIRPPLSPASRDRKTRSSNFLNPIRLAFPRRSSSPLARPSPISPYRATETESAPATLGTNWAFSLSTSSSPSPQPYLCLPPAAAEKAETKLRDTQRAAQRRKRLRSARAWFSPSKLFSAVLP